MLGVKPKKRKRLVIRLIAAVGLLLPVLAIQPTAPAHAATPGSIAWQTDLPGLYGGGQFIGNADGGVTIGSCVNNSSFTTAIKRFGPDGTVLGTVPTTTSPPAICSGISAVDANGTVYGQIYTGSSSLSQIAAYQGNNMLWTANLPQTSCNGSGGVTAMTIGADRNVYALINEPCGGTNQLRLVGFNPNLATGQTTPTMTLNQLLGNYSGAASFLAAYNNGLVLRYDGSLRYYNYAGVAGTVLPANYGPIYNGQLSASPSTGRVFVPVAADPSTTSGCTTPSMVVGQIDSSDSNGVYIPGFYRLAPCSSVVSICTAPSGGALITTRVEPTDISLPTENHVIMLDARGVVIWDKALPRGDFRAQTLFMVGQTDASVDQTGGVTVWRRTNSGQHVQVQTMTAYSGDVTATFSTSSIDPNATFNFYMNGVVTAWDHVYLMATKCVNGGCPYPTLYAINMPTAMDYPRGAILRPGAQPLNYVALGDSYSSGEGVPPFLTPTDTDNCHRSTAAYSTVLSASALNLISLQRFVACSGATTTDLLNGKNGEPSQLNALNSSTDVVTLTLGGNDVSFTQVAQTCLLADCAPYRQQYMNTVSQVGSKLSSAYDAILNAAPNATVYVMGYPFVLPQQGCPQTNEWMNALNVLAYNSANPASPSSAASTVTLSAIADKVGLSPSDKNVLLTSGSVQFSAEELSLIRDFTVALNQQIQTTVASKGSRMVYVDPTASISPFVGHELCTPTPYFNGLAAPWQVEYSFHPNAAGQDAYRRLVASYMGP